MMPEDTQIRQRLAQVGCKEGYEDYSAFDEGKDDIQTDNILKAVKDTKPISKVMGAKVAKLREKAKGQYRYASSWAKDQAGKHEVKTGKGRKLDLSDALDNMDEVVSTPKKRHKKAKAKNRFQEVAEEN